MIVFEFGPRGVTPVVYESFRCIPSAARKLTQDPSTFTGCALDSGFTARKRLFDDPRYTSRRVLPSPETVTGHCCCRTLTLDAMSTLFIRRLVTSPSELT